MAVSPEGGRTADIHNETVGGQDSVTLLSTFILHRTTDGLRIVFYLNHKDLTDVLTPDAHATQ